MESSSKEANKRQKIQESPKNITKKTTVNDDIKETTSNVASSSSSANPINSTNDHNEIDFIYSDSGISLTSIENLPPKENIKCVTLEEIISTVKKLKYYFSF